jgi:hypothetical protein
VALHQVCGLHHLLLFAIEFSRKVQQPFHHVSAAFKMAGEVIANVAMAVDFLRKFLRLS